MTFLNKIAKKFLLIFIININQIYSIDNYIDTAFGSENKGIILGSTYNEIVDIVVLNNGYLICGGINRTKNQRSFTLMSFDQDGLLNRNFGQNGIINSKISQFDFLNAITVTYDNKILICGSSSINDKTAILIAKYNDNGSLDNTFGNTGIVLTTLFSGAQANTICVTKDNKIIVSGGVVVDGKGELFLTCYNPDGSPDQNFGRNGIVTKLINDQSNSNFIIYQKQYNKIIIIGYSKNAQTGIFDTILIRYNEDGTIDKNFGLNGITTLRVREAIITIPNSMSFCSDGSILVLGSSTNRNDDKQIYLAKITKDGQIDTSFGPNSDGILLDLLPNRFIMRRSAIFTTDKANPANLMLKIQRARHNESQCIRDDFANNLMLNLDQNTQASDIAVDENDNIYISGFCFSELNNNKFCIFKLSPQGIRDQSFGDDGCIITALGNNAKTNAIALQNNCPIVAGFSDNNMAIVKYLGNNEQFIKIADSNNLNRCNKQILINGFSCAANSKVVVKLDNQIVNTTLTDDKGNWKIEKQYYLCNGQHQIDASIFINDKIIQAKKNITINADDYITIESPKNNSYVFKNKIKISGFSSQANKQVKITMDGILFKEVLTDKFGRWDIGVVPNIFDNGKHKIEAILLDGAHEIAKEENSIIVNRLNSICITTPTKNSKIYSEPTIINGKSSLPNAEVLVYLNEQFITLTNTDNLGNWQAKVSSKVRSGINIACAKLIDPNSGSTLADSNINFIY